MIDVTLTKEEQLICQEKAEARYKIARELGLKQLRIDKSPMNVDLLGVQGEMAFAKLFNLHTPMVEHGADAGWDYEINGITIDVKTASKPHYRLIFRELPAFKAQVAVLVVKISEDVFRIKGWASKKNFINWSKPMDDEGFALEDNHLRKIQNLWLNTAIKGLK
jgi:hypothetical protein